VIQVPTTACFDCTLLAISPDQHILRIPRFGIEDARSLLNQAYQRPVQDAEQQLTVITDFITLEAQNALLKVLEEPPTSTVFLFVLPRDFTILPTLASRFYFNTEYRNGAVEVDVQNFDAFIKQLYSERLSAIETSVKKEDQAWQRSIKYGLIKHLATLPSEHPSYQTIEYVARNLLTRGASNKMLLEQAALTLSLVKK
jgi:hypothetical protein